MRRVLLAVIALIGLSATALAADDWESCKLFGMPDPRIAACTRVIEKGDSKIDLSLAFTFRGSAHNAKGEKDQAIADYNEAIRRDPRRTAYNRGLIKAAAGDRDGALADLDEAIRQDPRSALAYNARGIVYNGKGDRDRAIADYNKAIEIDPTLAVAYSNRANLLRDRDEIDRALADYSTAIGLDPNYALSFNNRGNAYAKRNDFDRAIADYSKAVELDPKNSIAFYNRALAYSGKGEFDRAIADYDKATELDPKYVIAFNARGNAYAKKADFDKAIADYGKAIELDSKYSFAFYNRALAYSAKGEFDRAIVDYDKAIELDPKYVIAYNARGNAYARKNDPDRALADYNKSIELDPKYALAFFNRGLTFSNKGDRDRAVADFDKAIELDPKFALPHNARGYHYFQKGEIDKAIEEYSKAVELDPKFALAFNNRGQAYEKKGDLDLAIADYQKVLDLPAASVADQQRQVIARQRIARATEAKRGVQLPPAPKRAALVIGNSNYASVGLLPNPTNDARAVAAAFRRLGFTDVMEGYDMTREQMGQAIKDFGDRAEGAEWAVVFFAGHGMEMGGVNYLIPTDAKLVRDTHVPDETISLTSVQTKVDSASKIGLVILDSCRNNPFLSRMVRSVASGTTRAIGRGLADVEPEGNMLVIYSAKHGTTAEDGTGEHSPFTEALLNHIEEPGLEINFLFRKVRDDVRTKTQKRQEPFLYGSLSSELLYFKSATAK